MPELFVTDIQPKTIDLVIDVLKSGYISEGQWVEAFEARLWKKFLLPNIFTTNSGTSALHLALILAGVKPGDEVILPAQTFVATGLAVLYCGARPVFADISFQDGNITGPYWWENKITNKTRAIIGVDWAGYPCNREVLDWVAKRHHLKLIIDAAHSLGAIYQGEYVGSDSLPDFTCFSFQAIKGLTTGDGGAVICKDWDDYLRGRKLRWFGIDRNNDEPDSTGERLYNLREVGYKYHMNNIAGAIGWSELDSFDMRINRRREIAKIYDRLILETDNLSKHVYEPYNQSSYWAYPLLVKNRESFMAEMSKVGIATSVIHHGIDRNAIFGGIDNSLKEQRYFDAMQVNIPVHHKLSDLDVDRIIWAINNWK